MGRLENLLDGQREPDAGSGVGGVGRIQVITQPDAPSVGINYGPGYSQAQAAGHGAFEFEGRMVDEPVVRRARAHRKGVIPTRINEKMVAGTR